MLNVDISPWFSPGDFDPHESVSLLHLRLACTVPSAGALTFSSTGVPFRKPCGSSETGLHRSYGTRRAASRKRGVLLVRTVTFFPTALHCGTRRNALLFSRY
jgi:hypothetical protein